MQYGLNGLLVLGLLAGPGCSSLSKTGNSKPVPINPTGPVSIELSGALSREEVIRYEFESIKRTVEQPPVAPGTPPQPTPEPKFSETKEYAKFVTQTKTKEVYPLGEITYEVTTVDKSGNVSLHDLAFPEKGEVLELILTRNSRVLKAGDYPPESIFFLPPLPLPSEPVKVGDTWTLKHQWLSSASGIPLELDLVVIFKNLYGCGEDDQCADLEIAGNVTLPEKISELILESEISGRIFFALRQGSVVWSEIRTNERLRTSTVSSVIQSCMESTIEKPASYVWPWRRKPDCTPSDSIAPQVPGTERS